MLDELFDEFFTELMHITAQRRFARAVALRVLEEMKRRIADADLSVVSSAEILDQLADELGGADGDG